ncbi:MAG: hypothetical protein AAF581_21050 [Planctomycetota bacterium]
MVYFGNKTFSNPNRGTPKDKLPLFILAAVGGFVGLLLYLAYTVTNREDLTHQVPKREAEISGAEELPPLPAPEPQTPFADNPDLVRGGESALVDPESVDYLFQRWLLDVPVPNEGVAPVVPDLKGRGEEFKGRRFTLELQLADAPYRRVGLVDGGGRSGVTQYYEVWGGDFNDAMHVVLFAEKSELLDQGTPVVAEVDFLQVYQYEMVPNAQNNHLVLGRAPMWVARSVKPRPAMQLAAGSWSPFFWVGGIMLVGTLVVIAVVMSQRVNAPRQRRFKMGSSTS